MIRLALAGFLAPALAFAQPRGSADPNWPCQQIKIAGLSLAAVWAGPAVGTEWKDNPAVAAEVQKLVPRRVPPEQAQVLIEDFARDAGGQKQALLLQLVAGLLSVLDQERDSVMAGLDRFGQRQKQLAIEIRADNEKLRTLRADPEADPTEVQELTRRLMWDAEVFQDRRQALSYACEVPSKIEQRLFMLAQQIQQQLK